MPPGTLDRLGTSIDVPAAVSHTPPAPPTHSPSAPAHSPDFRSVNWFGTVYSFTGNQAAAVRVLWEAWEAGAPDVGDETLLSAVDPEAPPAKLAYVFNKHPAWGTLIVAGGSKGAHRLAS